MFNKLYAPHSENSSRNAGAEAERDAQNFLTTKGLQFTAKNYRCKLGELDLIMRDGDYLVFVEVRYRKPSRYGSPLETVDIRKQNKLRKAAQVFMQHHGLANRYPCRFDVVGIHGSKIEWVKGAF